ncbi:MAG: LssY C-terminal domain-containing protein [Propionibacteriaceae bacterium]|nr:LssY C-terminal domain-containing protein [Propionibacteriaceae bacterium]
MPTRKPPVYDHPPAKQAAEPGSGRYLRRTLGNVFDGGLFLFGAISTFVLAWLLLRQGMQWSFGLILYFVLMWLVTTYLALPRMHQALTSIYVPHYFIGRSRTGDGLLGDPVNLALDGSAEQIHTAMRRAGWTMADPINLRSSLRIVWGSITRKSYAEAPVSSLYLFGRKQDFAYQMEVDGNPAQRHHVRFWRCPEGWLLPGGEKVQWLAAGTYDRSVGLSLFTLQVTHKIDADIDVERDFIVDSVLYANADAEVRVIENFSTGYHSRNGGGDLIRTDGNLPVLQVGGLKPQPELVPVTEDAPTTTDMGRRPLSVVVGTVLVLALLVWDVYSLLTADLDLDAPDGPDGIDAGLVTGILLGLTVVLAGFNAICAWLTYQGRTWARRLVLTGTALTVLTGLQAMATELFSTTFLATMVHTSLGVGAIYSLTGPAAQDWGRDPGTE